MRSFLLPVILGFAFLSQGFSQSFNEDLLLGGWKSKDGVSAAFYPRNPKTKLGLVYFDVDRPGVTIRWIGTWKEITSGKWQGYLQLNGMVASFLRSGKEMTPGPDEHALLLGIYEPVLSVIKGGGFPDRSGEYYSLELDGIPVDFNKAFPAKDLPVPPESQGE
jgi:hypothetical protein